MGQVQRANDLVDEVAQLDPGTRPAKGRHRPAGADRAEPGVRAGDAVQLEQVLLNLLINARQAMLGRGGSLTIKAAGATEDGRATPEFRSPTPAAAFPEKLLPKKSSSPFFTTKGTARNGEGSRHRPGPGHLQGNHRAPRRAHRSRPARSAAARRSPSTCRWRRHLQKPSRHG